MYDILYNIIYTYLMNIWSSSIAAPPQKRSWTMTADASMSFSDKALPVPPQGRLDSRIAIKVCFDGTCFELFAFEIIWNCDFHRSGVHSSFVCSVGVSLGSQWLTPFRFWSHIQLQLGIYSKKTMITVNNCGGCKGLACIVTQHPCTVVVSNHDLILLVLESTLHPLLCRRPS